MSAGSLPPLAASLATTSLCSHMFIVAESDVCIVDPLKVPDLSCCAM